MNALFLWENTEGSPTNEGKWYFIRRYRSELLARCDWTQLGDAPLTVEEKQAWSAYRQALRDLPQIFATPDEVVFPETP